MTGLDNAAAQELLLKAARIPPDQYEVQTPYAQNVSALLGSHPLALVQAGAFVARGHCTLQQYPEVFQRKRQQLLQFRPTQAQSRYKDVYATFEASAEMMESSDDETARDALQLLSVLSMMTPSPLPLRLFKTAWEECQKREFLNDADDDGDVRDLTTRHVDHLISPLKLRAGSWDSHQLVEAIHLLKSLSLLSEETSNGLTSISMHPLTHSWARDRQSPDSQVQSWFATGSMIALSGMTYHSTGNDDLWSPHNRQLRPHLLEFMNLETDDVFEKGPKIMIARILYRCGWLLYSMREDYTLRGSLDELFERLGLERENVSEAWLPLHELAAYNLKNCGRPSEAVTQLEGIVEIRNATLPEEHSARLKSQLELAIAYDLDGRVADARSLLEQVVEVHKRLSLPREEAELLSSQHALAMVYVQSGRVAEAVTLLEQVVKTWERTLPREHPERLTSQHALAGACMANGQIAEAVSLLEQVVEIQERTQVDTHPSRLNSQHELARAYTANGQTAEAVLLLRQVVKIKERTLAETHPDRLASQHELARILWPTGQKHEALQIQKHVVSIRQSVLAPDNPNRLGSEHNLAGYLWNTGQKHEALHIHQHVISVHQRILR